MSLFFIVVLWQPAYCGSYEPNVQNKIDWDILGQRGRWLHAFLAVDEMYSDNIYYSDIDKQDDFITLIRPGIGLTTPGGEARPKEVRTSVYTPGGMPISQFALPEIRRFNASLFYQPEFEIYSDHSNLNVTNQQFQGALQYNSRGGLSIKLLDRFMNTYDPYSRDLALFQEKAQYITNLASVALGYRFSDKLKIDVDYSNFLVDYDEQRDDDLDRKDNTVTGYIYFQFQPKVAVFTGYELTKVEYDRNVFPNSTENRFYGGFQWDITEKSRGRIKAGYGVKDFDDSDIDSVNDTIYELQLDYNFTTKTSLKLRAYRKTEESEFSSYDYRLAHRIEANYLQKVTGKIFLGLNMAYSHESYEGGMNLPGEPENLKDDVYDLNPYIQYHFRDWFSMNLEYRYEKRDSNSELYDFTTNSVLIGLTVGI